MTPDTPTALEASIAHHKRLLVCETVAAALDEGLGSLGCALCNMFWNTNGCRVDCPVKKSTGKDWCRGTPHEQEKLALHTWADGTGTREQFRAAVQQEIEFLESLRETK